MNFILCVLAGDPETEQRLANEIRLVARGLVDFEIFVGARFLQKSQVVFVDESAAHRIGEVERKGRAVFLITSETRTPPIALTEGAVDDVLIHPFRPLEVLSRLRHFQQILLWDEVSTLNASFGDLVERLRDDFSLAERLQKLRTPDRFPDLKGFKVGSRYLAGMRSGGDHFDLADSAGGSLSLVLTDSSSYGLSSAVLSTLMRVAMKLSAAEAGSSAATVARIREELAAVLGEKDRLSLLYGIISRRDLRLRYVHCGSACLVYAAPGAPARAIVSAAPAMSRQLAKAAGAESSSLSDGGALPEAELQLHPDGRLVVASDGFVDACGGPDLLRAFVDEHRQREAKDVLNELAFKVRSRLAADDMPEQDCTAAVFDIDSRVLRLAR